MENENFLETSNVLKIMTLHGSLDAHKVGDSQCPHSHPFLGFCRLPGSHLTPQVLTPTFNSPRSCIPVQCMTESVVLCLKGLFLTVEVKFQLHEDFTEGEPNLSCKC